MEAKGNAKPANLPVKAVLSKAERRAQQIAQRAAKGQSPGGGSSTLPRPTISPIASTSQSKSTKAETKPSHAKASLVSSLPLNVTSPNADPITFSKFFKHLDPSLTLPSTPKIDRKLIESVHPAILKLGLKFSEFKIVGANARCIAMLEAFKEVSKEVNMSYSRSYWNLFSTGELMAGLWCIANV